MTAFLCVLSPALLVRSGLRALCLGSVLLSTASLVAPAARARPNIVVIMADDLGYADLSCYGSKRQPTPRIDQLAMEGVRFTDFHSSGPSCSPTRAAFMTGLYQQRVGIEIPLNIGEAGLPSAAVTLPETLKRSGYWTAIFGKWHLGDLAGSGPNSHGYDSFVGHLSSESDYVSHIDREGKPDWWRNEKPENNPRYNTHAITDEAVRYIQDNRQSPFLMVVAHTAIHFPWMTPMDPAYRQPGIDLTKGLKKLGPRGVDADLSAVVEYMVQELDNSVGRIMEVLDAEGLSDNTLVVFTSDNGGYIHYQGNHTGQISDNGPFKGQKGSLFEGGHRVPAIFRWPGKIKPGQITNELALTMDLMPTFLAICGASRENPSGAPRIDGIDLSGLLFEHKPLDRQGPVFWKVGTRAAARRGDWKLIRDEGASQLFNLRSDPGENSNLIQSHGNLAAELEKAMDTWITSVTTNTVR